MHHPWAVHMFLYIFYFLFIFQLANIVASPKINQHHSTDNSLASTPLTTKPAAPKTWLVSDSNEFRVALSSEAIFSFKYWLFIGWYNPRNISWVKKAGKAKNNLKAPMAVKKTNKPTSDNVIDIAFRSLLIFWSNHGP